MSGVLSANAASPLVRPPLPSSQWTEHRNAQGRVYWYHQVEKRSVWEKPPELKSARERAMDSTPWREYQKGDRKYYVHSVTKESSWSLPQELKDLFASIPDEPAQFAAMHAGGGSQSPAGAMMSPSATPQFARPPAGPPSGVLPTKPSFEGASSPRPATTGMSGPSDISSPAQQPPTAPLSIAGGEEAFIALLKDKGVDPSWTWEQTMRTIITEPLYKSLKTLAERKAAFSKYINGIKEEEQALKKSQAAQVEPRVREEVNANLKVGIVGWWLSYEGLLTRSGEESAWRSLAKIGEKQARGLWDVIRKELKEKQESSQRETRHRNMDMLMSLLKTFEADVLTRWKDARQTIIESEEWEKDPDLKTMDLSDMIIVFDEHVKSLEREKTQELKEKAKRRRRDDRKRREWFREKLKGWRHSGFLTSQTIWPDIYKVVEDEEYFKDMLAQPGSSPLDLFYDELDDLTMEIKDLTELIEPLLSPLVIREETTWEEFKSKIDVIRLNDDEVGEKSEVQLKLAFEEMVKSAAHRRREEKRRAERKLRHLGDDLRYAFKKVHIPEMETEEELNKGWDAWKPRIEGLGLKEWSDFNNSGFTFSEEQVEEVRKGAWERHVRRLKDKLEERRKHEGGRMSSEGPESRKRRGEHLDPDEGMEVERSSRPSRRARHDDDEKVTSRVSRRERRAGAEGDLDAEREKHRERRERRNPEKRIKLNYDGEDGDPDSEKEEGEV